MKSSTSDIDIDQLLRSFFCRESPSRWPAAPNTDTMTLVRPARTMAANRVLVGISLAALLAMYMGLATFFPRESASGLNPNREPIIGQLPVPPKVLETSPGPQP